MEKILAVLLSVILVLSLTACGSGDGDSSGASDQKNANDTGNGNVDAEAEEEDRPDAGANAEEAEEANAEEEEEEEEGTSASTVGDRPLVIYFSRTGEQYGVGKIDKGNTEIVAEIIAEETGADLYQVLPAEDYYPYTYDELTDIAKQEQNENARPAYAGDGPDLSKYDTIYIGAPVWWGDWPMIMYTFFEANEEGLSGKTLAPFSTHAGSGLSGFDSKLQSAIPTATVAEGLGVRGSDAQDNQDGVRDTVQDWIVKLGL